MSIDSKPTFASTSPPAAAANRATPLTSTAATTPVSRSNPILRSLHRTWGLVGLSLRRLRHQLGLSLLALIGIVLAVGLVTSAGFFSQAVDLVVMRQELAEYTRITGRPPFSARVFTVHSASVPLSLARAETLGRQVANTLSDAVGLPQRETALQLNSDIVKLVTFDDDGNVNRASARNTNLIYIENITPHMTILEGADFDAEGSSNQALDVWIYADWADSTGMQVDETHTLQVGDNLLPIRIAGIWRAADADDPFWMSDPDESLADKLITRRQDYVISVEPLTDIPVRSVTWRVVLDESQARPSEGRQYVTGFERAGLLINRFLPEARLTTPSLPLADFVNRQTTLTTLLLGFNVPGLGFLLYFLVLTSAVIAYWQRREIAIMVSRGMGRLTVLNFTLVEALILFALGLPLGVGFGMLLARLMGYTASFLSFLQRDPLPVSLDGFNWRLIALTLGIVLAARLWAAALASSQSVATQEREYSRPQQGPFWYRYYLDLLLILPTTYAYDQLVSQGSLGMLVQDNPADLYKDPLLILVPALFIVSLSLIAMRPFPWVMRFLDWIANRSPWLPLPISSD
ncbi:MAG: ABC transporter permease [Caldilineaceae bacterium]